jgi:hypothetical protein
MTNTEKKPEMVKLRNIGKSTIFGVHPDEFHDNGEPKGYAFKPDTSGAFHPDEAAKLKRLYPRTLQDIGDVTKLFHESAPEENLDTFEEKPEMISLEQAEALKQLAIEEAVEKAVAAALAARDKEDAKTAKKDGKKGGKEKTAEEIEFEKELEAEEKAKAEADAK